MLRYGLSNEQFRNRRASGWRWRLRAWWRILLSFFLLVALIHMGSAGSLSWVPPEERQSVDLSVPLKTLKGQKASLEGLKGKIIFLNFWATWCGPCRREMPDIERMQQQLAAQGVEVVLLSDDSQEDVQAYLDKSPFPFRFLLDSENELTFKLGVEVLPTTLIVDRQGRAALVHVGAYDWDSPQAIQELRRLAAE